MLKATLRSGLLFLLLAGRTTAGEMAAPAPSPAGGPAAFPEAGGEKTVTCFWKPVLPDPDYEPGEGGIFLISVSGDDRNNLSLSYRRLKPWRGDVRLAVHTRQTTDNRVLVDGGNPGLFSAATGEFTLSVAVPSGWPLFLVEAGENPYADPAVLSNIVELP